MTYQHRLIAGLLAEGYIKAPIQPSAKYTTFVKRLDDNRLHKLHVGKYGALRTGDSISKGFSLGDPSNQTPVYLRILAAGTQMNPVLHSDNLSDNN